MGIRQQVARLPFFSLLIAASFLIGWFLPAFYDWTGTEQTRASPLLGQTALLLCVAAVIMCAVLPWLPIGVSAAETSQSDRVRFQLRTILAMTAVSAVVIAALTKFPTLVGGGLCAIAFGYVLRFLILDRPHRWQTVALLACMYLPYTWLIAHSQIDDLLQAIFSIACGLPAFFPACLIGSLAGKNSHDMFWLAALLTAVEVVVGILMIRLGPRRTIAYLLLVILMSTFGSLLMHAMVRA